MAFVLSPAERRNPFANPVDLVGGTQIVDGLATSHQHGVPHSEDGPLKLRMLIGVLEHDAHIVLKLFDGHLTAEVSLLRILNQTVLAKD
jgi:hypothetical protein